MREYVCLVEDKRNVKIMRLKVKYPATAREENKYNGKRKANRI